MNISKQWLHEWVELNDSDEELVDQLTIAGLESDGIRPANPGFSGVTIARIEHIARHPDSETLRICSVFRGTEEDTIEVVSGAGNIRVGMHIALAIKGTVLPGNITVKPIDIKGVLSAGMLCSASELGLSEISAGVMEFPDDMPVGERLENILLLDDRIIVLSLTPNRGDCLSIAGVARELSAVNNCQLKPAVATIYEQSDARAEAKNNGKTRDIILHEPSACARYASQIITGVDATKPTPLWLSERLRRCGLRSINVIVDITNYVMLELGQPLHAYNNEQLQGAVHVRYARAGEKFEALNDCEYELSGDTLVIADDDNVVAMAGVIGGRQSAISGDTKDIFMESAFFTPLALLGKPRQYGLHTESSHRFERGVDFKLQKYALARATRLITEICGGRAELVNDQSIENMLPQLPAIELRYQQIERFLGVRIPDREVHDMLERLNMKVVPDKTKCLVTPPSFRFDINIEADLIEELARLYGYDNIEPQSPSASLALHEINEPHEQIKKLRNLLISRHFQEIITYSFIDPAILALLDPDATTLRLANPLASDASSMRTTLLPGLLNAMRYNQQRQQKRIRLFETGLIFNFNDELEQEPGIAGAITGNINIKQWGIEDRSSDFYDLKKDVEALINLYDNKAGITFTAIRHTALHPWQSAAIKVNDQHIGFIGALHPSLYDALELTGEVFVFEIKLTCFTKRRISTYRAISKFPSVRRDISIIVDKEISAADIMNFIVDTAPNTLQELELFDIYKHEMIGEEKKSLSFSLIFQQTSGTLTDDSVESITVAILEALYSRFDASLRE